MKQKKKQKKQSQQLLQVLQRTGYGKAKTEIKYKRKGEANIFIKQNGYISKEEKERIQNAELEEREEEATEENDIERVNKYLT